MWKYLLAIAILAGLTFFVTRQDQRAAQESAKKTAQPNNGAIPESNKQHPQEYIENANAPGWYSFFRWPTGTTTWAIILTLLAIAEQTSQTAKAAKATKESANATRDSAKTTQQNVDLQKAAYRQWLKIENWEATTPGILGETGLGIMFVNFDMRNPTEFPLTIRQISIKENGAGVSPTPFEFNTNRFMPPSDKFQFRVQVFIDKGAAESYHAGRGKIFITVVGSPQKSASVSAKNTAMVRVSANWPIRMASRSGRRIQRAERNPFRPSNLRSPKQIAELR